MPSLDQIHPLLPWATSSVALLGASLAIVITAVVVAMVKCVRIKKVNKHGLEHVSQDRPEYFISGEVDGKNVQWGPGDWMRPLGHMEVTLAIGGYFNTFNTAQAIWITSETQLSLQFVRQALEHLVQRIPILNVCIQRRRTQLWFRRVQETVIDFDVLHEDTMKVFHQVQAGTYDMKRSPLWRARMVHLPPGEQSPRGIVAKKHQAMLVFGIHHAITDATTNLIICRELVCIMNDMMQGRPISSPSYPLSPPHAEELVDSTASYLLKFFCKRFFDVVIFDFNKKTTFKGLLPLPKNYVAQTKILHHVFSEDCTKQLIMKCKEHSATVHSCIVTAANAAFFDIVCKKSNDSVKKATIYYADAINLRRYYPQRNLEHIGCHIGAHMQEHTISAGCKDAFWNSARHSKDNLHRDLMNRTCLKVIPIAKWEGILLPINMYKNSRKATNITSNHYVTTNMGDVTNIIGKNGHQDPIEISDLLRTFTSELAGHLTMITCHTFKGRLYLSFDYSANKITDENAQELFISLQNRLKDIAETANIT